LGGCLVDDSNGYRIADLAVGMTATLSRTVTEADIARFADITGDTNPVHVDEVYAAGTLFKGRVAHGILAAGLVSAVLGTRLPGPGSVYLSQTLKFVAPVRPGDTIEARVTVKKLMPEKRRVLLATVCTVGTRVVLEGEALVMTRA
jgi:3-hydroxybutyryl-CoA dehydratase